jgi:hypothetical protein
MGASQLANMAQIEKIFAKSTIFLLIISSFFLAIKDVSENNKSAKAALASGEEISHMNVLDIFRYGTE